ncbi:redoxin domain-containing protein [Bradyrhizobium sp. U87765 SZCCT0131]|uniref:peroxiredoxin n=1 Tax=unclassified Bradyrhizobium TaxID=2631580 RepID=UPI001BA7A054|nr:MULTISPECIES: peroxiredoxin [unclassified Bradyrhizobium]MBR1220356.1 redoxin domain-containing protein [Bradyrhizobium sp. U87765 SZCCT0131]MBR1263189.1 redoxin domain-containing protein [Bradyrhizobium sp. U87765 SZCCT0134]MBR1306928.1 redoxin domain-containing protein [Bradyrhizobium sp. U87765 SZCCT0110]MBR1323427.1 redoxin domain-containing protein [Bradyrhizobium sp. U87765 SZCCT0109]MBR1345882.1 redoxin domain-containing protein [Bradyrhizobium sp. U87765 SZCCT0048]
MSKETRKKTSKPAPAPRSRAATRGKTGAATGSGAKIPPKIAPKTTSGDHPAPRSAKNLAKNLAKTPTKTPTKAVTKAVAKTGPKAAPKTALKAKSATSAAPQMELAEGQAAPAFQLPRDGGKTLSLRDYAGRNLVLFFYPKADTPGCTREAMDFSRLAADFAAADTDVVGVSADPVKKQDSFKNKHKLATPLASDENKEMLAAYGAWGEKSMYGRAFMGILRTTVLIGKTGKIIRVWRHVKVDGHAEAVLEAVRSL